MSSTVVNDSFELLLGAVAVDLLIFVSSEMHIIKTNKKEIIRNGFKITPPFVIIYSPFVFQVALLLGNSEMKIDIASTEEITRIDFKLVPPKCVSYWSFVSQ